jgi:hypothetical protein
MQEALKIAPQELKAFPKIFHIGAPEITNLFTGPVEITEKVDGSQIGFGKLEDGTLVIRSKGRIMYDGGIYQEQKLFKSAVNHILLIQDKIAPGMFFYGEAVTSPHHNTMSYAKTPKNFIALYGVRTPNGWVTHHSQLEIIAASLDIDVVPLLFSGTVETKADLDKLLETTSFLGNEKIEGVVVKNYGQSSSFALSTECFGKYVREGFKERNGATNAKIKGNDFLELASSFAAEPRWVKAVQHLRDDGKLTNSPRDIGLIIPEVIKDLELEEGTFIKEQLYRIFIKQIKTASTRGVPEWYKQKLMEGAFGGPISQNQEPKQDKTPEPIQETVEGV